MITVSAEDLERYRSEGELPAELEPVATVRSVTLDADDPRHQDFETQWWGDCANTFSEENKQLVYAGLMGLVQTSLGEKWPVYDLGRRSVLDVGGGPCSILLKCVNAGDAVVVDPAPYPAWTKARYDLCDIELVQGRAEDYLGSLEPDSFDEAWCYNVLQHVVDPERIVRLMRLVADTVRMCEWVHTAPTLGHPHTLLPERLNEWLEGAGHVVNLNQNGCVGMAYVGVFRK